MWQVSRDTATGKFIVYLSSGERWPLLFNNEEIARDFAAALNLGRKERLAP